MSFIFKYTDRNHINIKPRLLKIPVSYKAEAGSPCHSVHRDSPRQNIVRESNQLDDRDCHHIELSVASWFII